MSEMNDDRLAKVAKMEIKHSQVKTLARKLNMAGAVDKIQDMIL